MENLAEIWPQIIMNGLVLGAVYTLLALGLALIFSIMRVVNIAHADLYMLGGVLTYFLFGQWHLNYFLTLIIVVACLAVAGAVSERFLFRRLRGTGLAGPLILSLGLSFFIRGATLVSFGERERGIPSPVTGVINIGGVSFGAERLVVMIVSLVLIVGLFYFIARVKSGQAMRALAQDAEAAYLQGIDINQMSMLAFAISIALAGLAGALLAPIFVVGYAIGAPLILKLFIIVVLGGLGSLPGAVAGGFLIGFVEAASFTLFSGKLSYLAIFAVMLIVFLIRPQGLMGKAELQ